MTAEAPPIQVLLVDDHSVVRRGIEAYLEVVDDIEMLGQAATGREALERIAELEAKG